MTLRAALFAAALALSGCGTEMLNVPPPFTGEPTPFSPPEDSWSRVLKAAVDEQGHVDYTAVLMNHADLDRYVAWVYERSPENWANYYPTGAHVVAYHINAYNALAIYNLLQAGVPASLSSSDRKQLYEQRQLLVGGQPLSLQAYRDHVLRKLGDPRVLLAISGGLASDPRLAREPYRASLLNDQLDRAARRFFADERNVRVDDARRRVELSPLLEAYSPEILRAAPSLQAFANRYRDKPLPADYAVGFGAFDGTLFGKGPR